MIVRHIVWPVFAVFITVLAASCVQAPDAPTGSAGIVRPGGVYVLCEGLWRQDNSELSYLQPEFVDVVRDVVSTVNPGLRLGDTASDVVVRGDTMYVCVSTSHTIESYRRSTGEWLGRMTMPAGPEPYRMVLADDSTAYCTNLNDDSITEFDPRTLTIRIERAAVGPAPEGIAVTRNAIFVANSGLGDLRAGEDGAGTVAVLDRSDLATVNSVRGLVNVAALKYDALRNRMWASYRNLPSRKDSLGGIVLIDPDRATIIGHWRYTAPRGMAIDDRTGLLYVLHADGIDEIDVTASTTRRIIGHVSRDGNDVWFALAFDPSRSLLWVGNARTYVLDGEALAISLDGGIVHRLTVGLNPTAFVF